MKAIRTTGETVIAWTRVADGLYVSADGRYEITRRPGVRSGDFRWIPYYVATRDGEQWDKRLSADGFGVRTLADAKGVCSVHADENGEQA